jgi:hypothetical protein
MAFSGISLENAVRNEAHEFRCRKGSIGVGWTAPLGRGSSASPTIYAFASAIQAPLSPSPEHISSGSV